MELKEKTITNLIPRFTQEDVEIARKAIIAEYGDMSLTFIINQAFTDVGRCIEALAIMGSRIGKDCYALANPENSKLLDSLMTCLVRYSGEAEDEDDANKAVNLWIELGKIKNYHWLGEF